MPKFKEGQQVIVRNAGAMVGKIIQQRPGDKGQPEEKTHYQVEIESPHWFSSTNIEAIPESNKFEQYSPEWMAEFSRAFEALQRWHANNNDTEALQQFSDAGKNIGWVVPMDPAKRKP
jgi:hypothetical protein